MPNLNYEFAIFPTKPQRLHLNRRMRDCRWQWNYAVKTRDQLIKSLECLRVEHVLKTILLSLSKKADTHVRKDAIKKMMEHHPEVPQGNWAKFYDLKIIFGNRYPITIAHLDVKVLAQEIKPILKREMSAYRAWNKKTKEQQKGKGAPKSPIYHALRNATSSYAGYEAKLYAVRAFTKVKSQTIHSSVSGNINSSFHRACNPSKEQRENGATGNPRFHKRNNSYIYQERKDVLREVNGKFQIRLQGLPRGMEWVDIHLHRSIPECAKLRYVCVKEAGDGWRAVLSLSVSESAYHIEPSRKDEMVGIDPGVINTLALAKFKRDDESFVGFEKFHYSPLSKSLRKLQILSRRIGRLRGPDRRRHQKPSLRWIRLNNQRRKLYAHISNQRKDILHNVSRYLATFGVVAIGEWEPPRKKGEGTRKQRREGRDRATATLRAMTVEKGKRAGTDIIAQGYTKEFFTTQRCSCCGERTGPTTTKIRIWDCANCGAKHDVDENAAINILMMALGKYEETF